jgi:hypothetical protein
MLFAMPKHSARRVAVAIAFAVCAIASIVRIAFVAAYAETDVERASSLWPGHPSVLSARAIVAVGEAAANHQPIDAPIRTLTADIARADPLAPEPFLIAGAEAQRSGDAPKAKMHLLKARQRDPRAPAPHFLLAQQYISEGRTREGLGEAAVLGRLVPGSLEPLSQAFARYIEAAGVPAGLEDVLRSNPDLSLRILNQLAANPRNASVLLRMAAMSPRSSGPAPGWQTRLIDELVNAGQYARARAVWAQLGGHRLDPSETVHDARFEGSNAPAPFNWTFATTGAVIERQPGSLHILYFGRDDAVLASQLLVLRPGSYRIRMAVSGQVADPRSFTWTITCLPGNNLLADRPTQPGHSDFEFEVPATGCGAQRLQLVAAADDSGRSSDFVISDFGLTPARVR